MTYRNLTQKEIIQLQAAGCEAEDWGNVLTSAEAVDHIKRVRFSGTVRFGKFERVFTFPGGLRKHAGMHDATLHNVTVGDDCLIENISNYIANYEIGHDTILENVDLPEHCHTIFRSNHVPNYANFAGNLPKDKERLLVEVQMAAEELDKLKTWDVYNDDRY